ARATVEPLGDCATVGGEEHTAHARVGTVGGAPGGEVQGAAHRGLEGVRAVCRLRHAVLPGVGAPGSDDEDADGAEGPPARTTSRRRAPTGRSTPHVLPPIRTVTVGPGVPPGQPALLTEGRGSRTVTAGSELHRPRSTCVRTAAASMPHPA